LNSINLLQKIRLIYDVMIYFNSTTMDKNELSQLIPEEINTHLQIFGKESWEMDYNLFGSCQFCNSRIDELGYCACGGSAD
jgi:hypothetical protein